LTHIVRGGESIGEGGADGGGDVYKRSTEPVLVLASDSYSEDKEILVGSSRPSSCPVYTVY